MSSTLKSKSAAVVFESDLFKKLERRIGVRYVLHKYNFGGATCDLYLFGKSGATDGFFWLEANGLVDRSCKRCSVEFEVWNVDDVIAQRRLARKFQEWDSKISYPWWSALVTERAFAGVSVINAVPSTTKNLEPGDDDLLFFHGQFSQAVSQHNAFLDEAAQKDAGLKERSQAMEVLNQRFQGFVAEAYRKRFVS